MKSDRMRTVQLNVCDSEDVARAVDHVTTTLKDPQKGMRGPGRPGDSSSQQALGEKDQEPEGAGGARMGRQGGSCP